MRGVGNLTCPRCKRPGFTYKSNLKKHLKGLRSYGGHELPDPEADYEVAKAEEEALHSAVMRVALGPSARPQAKQTDQAPEALPKRPMEPHAAFLFDLFQSLVANKSIPKFQFERRVDAMIAMFLPDIFAKCLGWEVDVVVPEFPIKKADNNQSTNADYLLFRHGDGGGVGDAWVLFELKTDRGSIREEQWDVYLEAARRGMPRLHQEIQAIASATKERQKYQELLKRLEGRPLDHPIEVVYLSPEPPFGDLPPNFRAILFEQLAGMRVDRHPEVWRLFRTLVLPVLC